LLLAGVKLNEVSESKPKSQKEQIRQQLLEEQLKLEEQEKPELYREREVDSLAKQIYQLDLEVKVVEDDFIESSRYDTRLKSLKKYSKDSYKKLLKKKFMAGQSDKLVANLLDMEEEEEEEGNNSGKKVDKKWKKKGDEESSEDEAQTNTKKGTYAD